MTKILEEILVNLVEKGGGNSISGMNFLMNFGDVFWPKSNWKRPPKNPCVELFLSK